MSKCELKGDELIFFPQARQTHDLSFDTTTTAGLPGVGAADRPKAVPGIPASV